MLILSFENEFLFTCKLNSFSYERMSTKTRFEKEAKGNSEMAYLIRKNIHLISGTGSELTGKESLQYNVADERKRPAVVFSLSFRQNEVSLSK